MIRCSRRLGVSPMPARRRWARWVSRFPICGGSGTASRRPSASTATPPRCLCVPTPMCCRTASGQCRGIRWPATTPRATAGRCSCTPTIRSIAIARLPRSDMVKIGEAPAEPLRKGERPLSGVRALDLTRWLAGPTSGRVLAENGADVLHIAAPHLPYQTEILMDTGHGKRCAWVDLTTPAGVETMTGLLRRADIFTQGYRPGTVASRGFSPEQVAALRPGIVCVSICAYGHEGPWAERRGFDSIVQNVTGLAATQGSLAKPRNLPVQALDYVA